MQGSTRPDDLQYFSLKKLQSNGISTKAIQHGIQQDSLDFLARECQTLMRATNAQVAVRHFQNQLVQRSTCISPRNVAVPMEHFPKSFATKFRLADRIEELVGVKLYAIQATIATMMMSYQMSSFKMIRCPRLPGNTTKSRLHQHQVFLYKPSGDSTVTS